MRYFSLFSFLILTISLSASFVQAQETEIVPLDDTISGLTEQDFANRAGAEDISVEIDAALDSAMVADALEQGLISQEEVGTLNQALEIIEANIDNFDLSIFIDEVLNNGRNDIRIWMV